MINIVLIFLFFSNSNINGTTLINSPTLAAWIQIRFPFDLFFENNKGTLYNNLIFENDVSKMLADSVEFNLLTGDTEVKMFNSENKVKIIKK